MSKPWPVHGFAFWDSTAGAPRTVPGVWGENHPGTVKMPDTSTKGAIQ